MKVLIIGADGFIGSKVAEALSSHEVIKASRTARPGVLELDLMNQNLINKTINRAKPDIIINCAGVLDSADTDSNARMTKNLMDALREGDHKVDKIIISGSAGEYGIVKPNELPVKETTPRRADSGYGLSKRKEVDTALDYKIKYGLPVVVARIFNPIGVGMNPKFIIPGILRQIDEIKAGKKTSIAVSRLDAKRDYVNVSDVAQAIKIMAEKKTSNDVYNIGSGQSTANSNLIDLLIKASNLDEVPELIETSEDAEPLFAIQADISLIKTDLGWQPRYTIEETVREIVDAPR